MMEPGESSKESSEGPIHEHPVMAGSEPVGNTTPLLGNYPPAHGMNIPPTNLQDAGKSPPYTARYPCTENVGITQPVIMVAPTRVYKKDYLGYSIFTMLCCCLPIGIAALIYSVNTRDANNRCDAAQAHRNSRTALTLNNVALGLGIVITITWIAFVIYLNVAARSYIVNYSSG